MTYELMIAFDDQSASFVHGFEAGRVYGAMKGKLHHIQETVHTVNAELFAQMAARESYTIKLTPLGDDGEWMELYAERVYRVDEVG